MLETNNHCPNARTMAVKMPVYGKGNHVLRYVLAPIVVGCGHCPYCRKKKQHEWETRLNIALREWKKEHPNGYVYFVTFTICDDSFTSIMADRYTEFNQLPPDQLTIDAIQTTANAKYIYNKYLKAHTFDLIRKKDCGNCPFKYYVACEFGDTYGRIHYHAYIFIENLDCVYDYLKTHKPDLWIKKYPGHYDSRGWHIPYKVSNGKNNPSRLQTNDECAVHTFLECFWDLGFVKKVSRACCSTSAYITKYVTKITDDNPNKVPFHRQSRDIGLLIDRICDALQKGQRYIVLDFFGKSVKWYIPKYYRAKYNALLGIDDIVQEEFIQGALNIFRECCVKHGLENTCVTKYGGGCDLAKGVLVFETSNFDHDNFMYLDNGYTCYQAMEYESNVSYHINKQNK